MIFDLVLRGGTVYDGTGKPGIVEDVAVRGGRIVAVGHGLRGRRELNCRGLAVAPGFVDLHTHAENVLDHPGASNFIHDGATTLVIGNCGGSKLDLKAFWRDLRKAKPAVNVATLVGHNSVRTKAMGGAFNRPPTPLESRRMSDLVAKAMRDGAVGLSTGLEYVPGFYTKTGEVTGLARVAARYHGLYASHLRSEGAQGAAALDEALEIGREANIQVHVSHLKIDTPAYWGQGKDRLAALAKARRSGVRATQDVYPYTAYSTTLGLLLPAWALEGGKAAVAKRLVDEEAKVRAGMANLRRQNGVKDYGWVALASAPDARLPGLRIPAAAKLVLGRDDLAAQEDLILDLMKKGGAGGVFFAMGDEDVDAIVKDPLSSIVCDSGVETPGPGHPHPRGYGSRARFLGYYVRERKVLPLSEAIRRLTSLPARTFHLKDRGEIRKGAWADLVVFDPKTIHDAATFENPRRESQGIRWTLVNGVAVVGPKGMTGARSGVGLKRGGTLAW